MYIVIILYRLGNNDKKKSLYAFSTDAAIVGLTTEYTSATSRFFPNIFNLRLVESTDMESVDAEGQLYAFILHPFDFTNIRY